MTGHGIGIFSFKLRTHILRQINEGHSLKRLISNGDRIRPLNDMIL